MHTRLQIQNIITVYIFFIGGAPCLDLVEQINMFNVAIPFLNVRNAYATGRCRFFALVIFFFSVWVSWKRSRDDTRKKMLGGGH